MTASLQLKKHLCQGKLQGDLYFAHLPGLTELTAVMSTRIQPGDSI
jgi:hypothetical protein